MAQTRKAKSKARATRRRSNKKITAKQAVKIADQRAVLNCETKIHDIQLNEITLNQGNAPHYYVVSDDHYKLTQGNGNSNMSGHHVNASGQKAHWFLKNNDNPLFVKIMWIYSRTGILPSATGVKLCETNTGDTTLGNNVFDLGRRINKDYFLVMKSWNFTMGSGSDNSTRPNVKIFSHYHNHRQRKLVYAGTNSYPTNGRFFYVVMARRCDNDGAGLTSLELSGTNCLYFKDP